MEKYRVNICNLDCAGCAREVQEGLNKDNRLNNVVVNFANSTITYEAEEEININELNKMVKKIEPEAVVSADEIEEQKEFSLIILIIAIVLGFIGLYVEITPLINEIFIISSYILLLYRTFLNAVKMLFRSMTVNENALITVSCIGAYLIGQKAEGLMVIVLYTIGKILEGKAVHKSRKSIKSLINIKQDYANKKEENSIIQIDVEDIKVGDILVVKKGERIPVDGVIIAGETELDMSMLTGESDLVTVKLNDKVLSGSINLGNVIEIKAVAEYKDSTTAKILELVETAADKKAKKETMVSKISRVYTPIVFILAVLMVLLGPSALNITFKESIYRALTFLVISCPCAIAISVPLSYFTGLGAASKNGILIKGSNYLDNLSKINKIIFDKTGTLTKGSFEVLDVEILDENYTKEEIIDILVKGESLSNHPIAKSILKLQKGELDNEAVKDFREIEGKGISYIIDDKNIKIGNKDICNCEEEAVLHLSINDKHVASISIDDGIKENASEVIDYLKKNKIRTYMFTGDKKDIAEEIGKRIKIDEIKYEMMPQDKYSEFEKIHGKNDLVSFVGDGINDSPVLKRADIGISMGSLGQEAAIDASDVVITGDELIKIPKAIKISKYTNHIIKENLTFAISVKILILLLSVFGLANMWLAVFADTGLTLLTILNTLRILKND